MSQEAMREYVLTEYDKFDARRKQLDASLADKQDLEEEVKDVGKISHYEALIKARQAY